MRRIVYSTLLFLLLSLSALAQNGGINFQGMARTAAGEALANQKISLRLSVLLNSESGTVEYSETKEATTSGQGIFSVVVGDGSILTKTGNFSDINWKNSPKFLKVELDPSGGTNFALLGTSRLQAVPFAYYANGVDAENIQGTLPVAKGGTGVGSITALKTSLGIDQVNNTADANKPISTATQAALDTKVDKVSGKGLSANDYTSAEKTKLAAISGTNTGDQDLSSLATTAALAGKVDKVTGKELSSNDFTTEEKTKLASITGTNTGDQDLSGFATTAALATKANTSDVTTSLALKANTADVTTGLAEKVDKVTGKELSSNDYSTAEKTKLAAIQGTNTGDQDLSGYATTTALATKANASDVTTSLVLKENAANKSTDSNLGGNATSDDFFPTQKAVKTYVDAQVTNGGIQDGSILTRHLANGAVTGIKLASDITGYKKFIDGAGGVALSNTVSTDLDVNTGSVAVGGTSNWQSFTAGLSGKLTAVEFQTVNPSSSGPSPVAYVEIYAEQGLGGTLLGTSTNISISGMGQNWYSFDLSSATVNLLVGSVYTARLVVNSTNQNYVYGDNALYNGGISNISSTWDFNIKTKIKQFTNDSFLTTSAANALYGNLVTNATHTGEVTGATTLTITDGAVTTSKLANSAVDLTTKVTGLLPTANIADGAISTTKLANNAVDLTTKVTGALASSNLADGAVTNTKLADGAVTNAKVTDVAASKITGTLSVANGGTGQTTYSNGQLLIGNSSNSLTKATITAGTGISITNGNGSISIVNTAVVVPSGINPGDMLYWNGSVWRGVPAGANNNFLTFVNGVPTWTPIIGATDVHNPVTGKVWMDRNLGATQVATSSTDQNSYGDLYQWGRSLDGHQLRTSVTTSSLSSSDTPGSSFILNLNLGDWRNPSNNSLWQGINGTNNPCPSGYRIPTQSEWQAELNTWPSPDPVGSFYSLLKLPLAGYRALNSGNVSLVGARGNYWSSTVNGPGSMYLYLGVTNSETAAINSNYRAYGFSVRCIKN